MKILFLSSWFPYPSDNGSKLRISALLQALARRHRVELLTLSSRAPSEDGLRELGGHRIGHGWIPTEDYQANSKRALLGYFSPRPRSIVATDCRQTANRVQRELRDGGYDLVVASELKTAAYMKYFQKVPAILEDIECGFFTNRARQAASPFVRLRRELTNLKLRHYLRVLLTGFSACTVVSETERAVLQDWVPDFRAVHVVPNCLRLEDYQVSNDPVESAAIFPGSLLYPPNREAVSWFQRHVLPRIVRRVKDFRVYITGAGVPPMNLDPRLVLTGYLKRPQLLELFGRVKLCVVPLLEGGGTRLKILESMALGVPVVATPLGAEGLEVLSGTHLCLAGSARSFSDQVVRLLCDAKERESLAAAARAHVARHHDCRRVLPAFLSLVDEVGGGR